MFSLSKENEWAFKIEKEDLEILKQGTIDFYSFSYYSSLVEEKMSLMQMEIYLMVGEIHI